MNLTFACPRCEATIRRALDATTTELDCAACGYRQSVSAGVIVDGRVEQCAVCPSRELYLRKDFSQSLGLGIIVAGFVASSVTWYFYLQYWTFAILVATAVVDVVLYLLVPNLLQCYRCHAQYRDVAGLDGHRPFDLETYERYRQQAARMEQQSG